MVMAVAAVGGITSHEKNADQQESGLGASLRNLEKALATGNLAGAQKAFSQAKQQLQATQPPENGVRAADSNPQGTTRSDMDALQKALNSGDLAAAQRAFVRLQEDKKDIAAVHGGSKMLQRNPPASALPNQNGGDSINDASAAGRVKALPKDPPPSALPNQDGGAAALELSGDAVEKGKLVDVYA
jgi:hypothetical protein